MAEVEIKSNIKLGFKDILEGISKLDAKDIESFLKEVSSILVKKKENALKNTKEAGLIRQITSIYPPLLDKRYKLLRTKLEKEKLSLKEQKELISLTNQFEVLDAQRLQYLVQLAQLRSQPLNEVIKEFSTRFKHA